MVDLHVPSNSGSETTITHHVSMKKEEKEIFLDNAEDWFNANDYVPDDSILSTFKELETLVPVQNNTGIHQSNNKNNYKYSLGYFIFLSDFV